MNDDRLGIYYRLLINNAPYCSISYFFFAVDLLFHFQARPNDFVFPSARNKSSGVFEDLF